MNKGIAQLPGPTLDLWQWQFKGACTGYDNSMFFHPDGERGRARKRRIAIAKGICATCPVIRECREHALKSREPYGVWGGLSEDDRQAILEGRYSQAS